MGECSQCGATGALTRHCNHCGKEVCSEHTLPEKHDCPAVDQFGTGSKHLQSDLEARRDPDTDATTPDEYQCSECGDAYEYYADAQHCCQETPDPIDAPQTHGGSGRNTDTADFPSSPDVNADGSISDDELNAQLDQIRESATAKQGLASTVSQKLDLVWLKLKLAMPSLRVLLLVLVLAVVAAGQLGLAPVPGFPVVP